MNDVWNVDERMITTEGLCSSWTFFRDSYVLVPLIDPIMQMSSRSRFVSFRASELHGPFANRTYLYIDVILDSNIVPMCVPSRSYP
jgi:hypothetical protein